MKLIRNKKINRIICFYLALSLIFQVVSPTVAFALTSGPAQEEFASFEPASTSDMVDLYSGDMTYNIPMLSVPGPNGGYPINLAYHSGVGMEQEASWVGLGWTLNVGAINRQLRGLPDDYAGETVNKTQKIKNTWTAAIDIPLPLSNTDKIFGLPKPSPASTSLFSNSLEIYYNNFKGTGFKYNLGVKYPASGQNSTASIGLNLSFDSQNGLDLEPQAGLNYAKNGAAFNGGFELSLKYNSRHGLESVNFSDHLSFNRLPIRKAALKKIASKNKQAEEKKEGSDASQKSPNTLDPGKYNQISSRSSTSFAGSFNVPQTNVQTKTTTVPFTVKLGFLAQRVEWEFKSQKLLTWSGYYTQTRVESNGNQTYNAYGYMNNLKPGTNNSVLRDFQRDNIPYSKKVPNLAMSNFTYDLFMQTGQGSAGMFRPFQNSVAILNDPDIKSKETSVSIDGELGVENTIPTPPSIENLHIGLDGKYGSGYNRSGYWSHIGTKPYQDFPYEFDQLKSIQTGDADYENSYEQMLGEKAGFYQGSADDQLNNLAGDNAIRVKLIKENHDNSFLNRSWKFDGIAHQQPNLSASTSSEKYFTTNENASSTLNLISTGTSANFYKKPHGRAKRASNVEKFTYDQEITLGIGYGHNYSFNDHTGGSGSIKTYSNPSNSSLTQKGSQMREMSVLQADGMRYVYGLPIVNKAQVDNVQSIYDANSGWAGLSGGTNGFIANSLNQSTVASNTFSSISSTVDGYQSKNEYSPYANSWLLTYIYSPDYVDRTNNGPTADDYGYWMRFNYGKYSDNYQWRIPYKDHNYMIAQIGNPQDDKASYSYGTKEIYYIESIQTKTHIAIFNTSPRLDGIMAKDEKDGGISPGYTCPGTSITGSDYLRKLDQIVLYTQGDYTTHGNNATPIKTVNFQYSYDLCQKLDNNKSSCGINNSNIYGISTAAANYIDETGASHTPSNMGGKLTLLKVWFTYQNSNRGSLSPYIFNYGITPFTSTGNTGCSYDQNPNYNKVDMDRWGNFKNNADGTYGAYGSSTNVYPYLQMPYTSQDINNDYNKAGCTSPSANKLSAAPWSLKKIFLPTGGVLNITYDFDDYAYVENQHAQDMFDVVGVGGSATSPPSNLVCGLTRKKPTSCSSIFPSSSSDIKNPIIWVRLNEPCTSANFYSKYLANLPAGQVYYKFFTNYQNLQSNSDPNLITQDYVSGYTTVSGSGYGVTTVTNPITGNTDYVGYFTLQTENISTTNLFNKAPVSPIYRSSIESLRASHSEWIYTSIPGGTTALSQITNLLGSIPTLFTDMGVAVLGFNDFADDSKYVQNYVLNGYSSIRLCNPEGNKIGGGVRVKKLTLDDRWDNDKNSSTTDNSQYGQEYDYTTKDANGNTISSGVAYEPKVGSEECALKTAVNYVNSTPLSCDYHTFVETPIGESHYPGSSVGYSKVTVSSIGPEESYKDYIAGGGGSSTISSTPCSVGQVDVYEFYTPKDFPVIFQQTDMGPYSKPIKITIPILGLFSSTISRQAQSQGYTIIQNDMAGKPKITSQYTGSIISVTDPCNPSATVLKVVPNQRVSQQQFLYNTVNPYNPNAVNQLSSNVQVISVDNNYNLQYQTGVLGQTHDFFVDMNENEQQHRTFGLQGNLDWQTYGVIPFSIPIFWFMVSYDQTYNNMRTVVTNKIINRTGILTKIINTVEQSTITTENLAFDLETGEVLLSKTNNEFEDPLYSFNYKGYWFYKNLGGSYQNFGINIPIGASSDPTYGTITIPTTGSFFTKGDQVYITAGSGHSGLYHVFKTDNTNPNQVITCIDITGSYFAHGTSVTSIQVVKSGYKNMLNTNVGSLEFKNTGAFTAYDPTNPSTLLASPTGLSFTNPTQNKILNATATEYSDNWQTLEGGINYGVATTTSCNCTPTQISIDYINWLKYLVTQGQLISQVNAVVNSITPLKVYDATNGTSPNFLPASMISAFGSSLDIFYLGILGNPQISGSTTCNLIGIFYGAYPGTGVGAWSQTYPGYPHTYFICNGCGLQFNLPAGLSSTINSESTGTIFWNDAISGMNTSNILATGVCSSTPSSMLNIPSSSFSGSYSIGMYPHDLNGACPSRPTSSDTSSRFVTPAVMMPCLNLVNCTQTNIPINNYQIVSSCGLQPGQQINPYIEAMKGIWRPKYNYAYHSLRLQNDNIREDGIFDDFQRFPWENASTRNIKWVRSNTVTKNLPHDFEVENVDPIGIFSSAVYGYNFTLPIAVSKNARYNEIAFDGFEDYPLVCEDDHFRFINVFNYTQNSMTNTNISTTYAHTGNYSLSIPVSSSASLIRLVKTIGNYNGYDFYTVDNNPLIDDYTPPGSSTSQLSGHYVAHILNDNDFLGKFAPIAGKKYVLSAWVRMGTLSSVPFTYTDPTITISYTGCSNCNPSPLISTGNIIDGWQRIYVELPSIPASATSITITLNNANTAVKAYFDDIRIHPFDANMESYVYDPITLKPVANLDANNYATIYNYDDEGHLIKVKRETKEGIKTVKEGRISTKKLPY
jgi:hypothetical protein